MIMCVKLKIKTIHFGLRLQWLESGHGLDVQRTLLNLVKELLDMRFISSGTMMK